MSGGEVVTDFELFWRAYPRKVGKGAARRAWAKLAPDTETVQKMLDALVWQRNQPQWMKDGGQYIPHPSTWLTQERFEDEPFHTPNLSAKSIRMLQTLGHNDDPKLLH